MNRSSRFLDDIPPECLAVRERVRPAIPREIPASLRRPVRAQWDEHDQRTDHDDGPVFTVDDLRDDGDLLGAGATVKHEAFGRGRVIEARGTGPARKLLIDFPAVGRKTVLARFVQPS